MDETELEQLLARGREQQGLECKAAGSRTDRVFFAKVVRACLAMANRRDGGKVLVGVRESKGTLIPVGVPTADLPSWSKDDVAAGVAAYSDPYVELEVDHVVYKGNTIVVISVGEFPDIPVICKKACESTLKAGVVYIRGVEKIESIPISTHYQMRTLLNLAVDKKLREFVEQMQRAGVLVGQGESAPAGASDKAAYDAELEDLL